MYNKATFAHQFKALLEKNGFSQRAMADRINTTETTISRYVSGDRTPNIETAVEIAQVLGVSVDTLLGVTAPAQARQAPDITILLECYSRASVEDRSVIWAVLNRYMRPDQKIVISTVQKEEKTEAV